MPPKGRKGNRGGAFGNAPDRSIRSNAPPAAAGAAVEADVMMTDVEYSDAPASAPVPAASAAPPGPRLHNPAAAEQVLAERRKTNLELGGTAYARLTDEKAVALPPRPPGLNKSGREIMVALNTFAVTKYPTKPVEQWDVLIGSGAEKRALVQKVWRSQTIKNVIGPDWIFDGNKLAWSLSKPKSYNIDVDLDAEAGRPAREGRSNVINVRITHAKQITFQVLQAYCDAKTDWDNSCFESINFLDHLMREWPSRAFTQVGRSFFSRAQQVVVLGPGVEAIRGVYSSIRVVGDPTRPGKARLGVNVDVSNTAFYQPRDMIDLVPLFAGASSLADLARALSRKPRREDNSADAKLYYRATVLLTRFLKRVRFTTPYRGCPNPEKVYTVGGFTFDKDSRHPDNAFDRDGGKVTVYKYFDSKYDLQLNWPQLPLVYTPGARGAKIPIECCRVVPMQKFIFKLDEKMTKAMMDFAVTLPPVRKQAIEAGLSSLNWNEDTFLKNYGMSIDRKWPQVKAKLLQNPTIQFGNKVENPGTSGRWNLKGLKFVSGNPTALKSWGVCIVGDRAKLRYCGPDEVAAFMKTFRDVYAGHGGRIDAPYRITHNEDPGKAVEQIYQDVKQSTGQPPQVLIFILASNDTNVYNRIKRQTDCRFGVVSQCMLASQIIKNNMQYMSNVCMKLNAKLGGNTMLARLSPPAASVLKVPTMIIGADVTHPAPGDRDKPSIAALAMSLDAQAARYAAVVESNGHRVEMITAHNFNTVLKPLVRKWVENTGKGKFPAQVIYFRDGISDTQYAQVLENEVKELKNMFVSIHETGKNIKFTVIIASKRHHVRFFPDKDKDRSANPLPGTLVEQGVTHPFDNDFYLCSHAAIKGTARPVHYYVIKNECGIGNTELQNMIYEHSYQYIRSTTPVSLYPAVYYAHLAADRGRCRLKPVKTDDTKPRSESKTPAEVDPLMSIPDASDSPFFYSMWYV